MTGLYHEGARELQDRFDTRRLADRLEEVKVHAAITPDDRAFIERMDMLFLATADREGRPQCSYKGGDPGFVSVVDEHTLAFPGYDGNGMYLSAGNVRVNPHVGLLFVDFGGRPPRRLPALHPPDGAGRALSVRPAPGPGGADAGVEARRLGARRPPALIRPRSRSPCRPPCG